MDDFNKQAQNLGISEGTLYGAINELRTSLEKRESDRYKELSGMRSSIVRIETTLKSSDKRLENLEHKVEIIATGQRDMQEEQNDIVEKHSYHSQKLTNINKEIDNIKKAAAGKFSFKDVESWRKIIPYIILGTAGVLGILKDKLF